MTSFVLTADEEAQLTALRRAAAQIRDASIVAGAAPLGIRGRATADGLFEQVFTLFDSEPFRSLAMSVRLVYMNDEPSNFGRICNVLYKSGDIALRPKVAQLREAYNAFLDGESVTFHLHGSYEGTTLGPRGVLQAWLYGWAFHQDPLEAGKYEELKKFGPAFEFGLHATVVRIVDLILALDSLVAATLAHVEKAGKAAT